METATAPSCFGGASSEASTPATWDEDNATRHFAITASQVPKPTGSTPPSLPNVATLSMMPEANNKSAGARFLDDCHESESPSPRLRSSRIFKGKGKETVTVAREQKKPLRLLDLPVDILKDIVKEVTHTNDLTSLALCHSALHQLTIPHIYSRFDIVWPDSTTHAEPRSGVDALTYGLATLVMAEEIFGEAPEQRQEQRNRFANGGSDWATETTVRRRRGNHYAQFTRKFSLGNGPQDWVQEYLITKEGGKMLGTLVALAVARMRSLETFIWDMPTGILRDVWLALSSLGDRRDRLCRLEKVWVRWHDNSSADPSNTIPPPAPAMALHSMPPAPLGAHPTFDSGPLASPQIQYGALDRVEHPSFSVLPTLKSLSVLDIDELAYLEEMAVLIGRSLDKLKELRVGIARHAMDREWMTVWEGSDVQQVDHNYPTAGYYTIGEKRLGGVLGTLTGFVCDMKKPKIVLRDLPRRRSATISASPTKIPSPSTQRSDTVIEHLSDVEPSGPVVGLSTLAEDATAKTRNDALPDPDEVVHTTSSQRPSESKDNGPFVQTCSLASKSSRSPSISSANVITTPGHDVPEARSDPFTPPESEPGPEPEVEYLDNTLQLNSLELERVPLSIPVLQKAIDWSHLTSLTLLQCHNHEQLWKTLRRVFAPRPKSPGYPHPRRNLNSTPRKGRHHSLSTLDIEFEYPLKLTKIHTNTVSSSLISFLRDTLAPNSLETLFLQEARSYSSVVTVEQIFKGPMRRHRNSLTKVLIDSSEKGSDGLPISSSRWRRWMLNREILGFICSGKMPALRELGMAIDYRDWHFFLQHLPTIPHLRSLSIPFLADHVHGTNVDPRELALQIVDIVALRPEVELCYMGIANKCFEILENRRPSSSFNRSGSTSSETGRPDSEHGLHGVGGAIVVDEDPGVSEGEEDEDAEEDADGDIEMEDDENAVDEIDTESDDVSDDDDDGDDTDSLDTDSGTGEGGTRRSGTARLRLREILFYDDKVAIFKARHGKL